jgi:hypothetical protein
MSLAPGIDALWLVVRGHPSSPDGGPDVVAVRTNVLAADVGTGCLVPVLAAVENQARFLSLSLITEPLGSQEDPELEWHGEPR